MQYVLPELALAAALALDSDGCVTALNDHAAELLGRSPEKIVGEPLTGFLEDESARRLEEHFIRAAAGERPVRCEVELTDGEERSKFLLVQTLAVASDDLEVVYYAALTDVTSYVDRLRSAERRRISAERVARSKTDLLARLSHEIRSSLASISGFADVLAESVPAANREITEIIRDSGRHLLDTLNSVMDLARLEYRKGDLKLSEVDVVPHVRRRMVLFEKLAAESGLDFAFRAESETAAARLNETFLDRIVHNLVDNAIKYTPAGKVEVSVEKREEQVWIYVADTGVGIRDDFLPRLFSPFEREHQDDDYSVEGVGLGLAITRYLVELMDGRIVACSTRGEGSTFTVSFPALERLPESKRQTAGNAPSGSNSRAKAGVFDDSD